MDINYYINEMRKLIKVTLCEKSLFVQDIIADMQQEVNRVHTLQGQASGC